jgi:CRP/FNR family transcriptional regulator
MPPDLPARLAAVMPSLASAGPELDALIAGSVQTLRLPAGTTVFRENDSCPGFPLVLSGRVRVLRSLESGREVSLYEVEPGESCVLSTGCLLGSQPYRAHGQCLTEVELALLPKPLFERLLAEHAPFRAEVLAMFSERLARLMELVEAFGFQRLDQRLAAELLGKGRRVEGSHDKLAQQLAVSRESVSRQLKQFEERGWVSLGRGVVTILDPRALRQLAAGQAESPSASDSPASGASAASAA